MDNVRAVAEKLYDDKGNVDDFIMSGVSDYDILNYEDSVMMSNEEEIPVETK